MTGPRCAGFLTISLGLIVAACTGSRPANDVNAERLAVQKEAEALQARHHALDEEIAAWSGNVGEWIKTNGIGLDPARVVLALSSRSFFLHEPQHAASGDAEYSRLEDQMQDIQAKRRAIESEWLELKSRDRASLQRMGLKPKEMQQEFAFEQGDSTIPIPGVSARQRCCPLTWPNDVFTGCKLTKETCRRDTATKQWRLVCHYECDPIVLTDK
jgi:hypothetical protein